ncbi:hypothetical protein [Prosthecochloris sp.]|uniref:hypothetical protein n=1 Tax=Prosthecochloris sp. TaxID=290513 RepID=UPI0025EC7CE0|nr:hypothetical protein [Prosthecochloris sp.]
MLEISLKIEKSGISFSSYRNNFATPVETTKKIHLFENKHPKEIRNTFNEL